MDEDADARMDGGREDAAAAAWRVVASCFGGLRWLLRVHPQARFDAATGRQEQRGRRAEAGGGKEWGAGANPLPPAPPTLPRKAVKLKAAFIERQRPFPALSLRVCTCSGSGSARRR